MPFTIRPAHSDDAEPAAALRRTVFPYQLMSAAEVRRKIAEPTPAQRGAIWVACSDGTVVGWAACGLNSWTSEEGVGFLTLHVHPDHRRAGIGTELVSRTDSHLADIGARRVQVFAAAESVDFAVAQGFAPTREMHFASLDPRVLPPCPPTPAGVDLVPIAAVDPRLVYDADTAASLDEPSAAPIDSFDYDEWLTEVWSAPMLDHDLSTAAMVDGKVACFTAVQTDGDRAWSGMTGTVRGHRGRGLAKLVKSTALARAASAGIVRASTSMDARNAPMLAINGWLGYRRVATQIGLTR
ncbi:Acetyltransferase (GNAT) family protein [Actinokineospora alba]|uniref:Acetyltransferase (GNAT) family protein n=1 Tax=Actinokineospora alba TaxID=504798 RepID=A0A1H0N3P2_9PSEU|nr:GNAT family N-acetyltransferase [Actinokineospora alba]TDP68554.1 acetyltransferase (GNAT) family protein [Actinokineospora alba]SDH81575.1 Acetyltransferase (GNAT) family protein [Actinokineospora alba]SDO87329.1 Acetyltransferase (GNAT) family protein [Actinokineospora alba]